VADCRTDGVCGRAREATRRAGRVGGGGGGRWRAAPRPAPRRVGVGRAVGRSGDAPAGAAVPARTDGGRRQRRPGRAAGACGADAGACEPFGDLDGRCTPAPPLPIDADCMRGVGASCRPRPFGRGMGWSQQRSHVASAPVWGWVAGGGRGGTVPRRVAHGGRGSDTAPTAAAGARTRPRTAAAPGTRVRPRGRGRWRSQRRLPPPAAGPRRTRR